MKKAVLHTFDLHLIQELHRRKPRGERSGFVNAALRARLHGEDEFDIKSIPTRNLMACLLARVDCPPIMKIILLEELK